MLFRMKSIFSFYAVSVYPENGFLMFSGKIDRDEWHEVG